MAQTYNLDEAAQKLGITPEEFKRRLKADWKTLKSFRDGPTLRFRTADIDELARSLGQASDSGLQPGDGGLALADSSEELSLDMPPPPPSRGRNAADKPLSLDDSDEDILSLTSADSGVSKKKKNTGDSDVRLDLTPSKKDPAAKELTEEISLDLSGPRSGILKSPSSRKLTPSSLKGPGSAKIPGPKSQPASDDSSSEFELSLDSDSDSFELQLNTDSSEEVDLGGPAATGNRGGQSGINLRKPADSGVSLENKLQQSDSDIDFELSLDSPLSGGRKPVSGGRKTTTDSDSEFELSLDDNSGVTDNIAEELGDENQGDIFETDFELPVVSDEESGSEVVAIDSADTDLENSDFDIAISDDDVVMEDDDSASQVMLVDDEAELLDGDAERLDDETAPRGKKKRPVAGFDDDVQLDDLETETGGSASAAMRGRRDEDDVPVRTVVAKPATWGPLPAILLLPCMVIVLIGGLMSFEVLRGMWGYQQPSKTSDSLVRGVAGTFGMKVPD